MAADNLETGTDEYQIRNLLADFARLADEAASVEEVAALFTTGGCWVMGPEAWRGRDEIVAYLQSARNSSGVGPAGRKRHIVTNVAVHVDTSDQARAHSCFLFVDAEPNPSILFVGQYQDRLERVDGRWLISEREVRVS
jgi:hypothetical protein